MFPYFSVHFTNDRYILLISAHIAGAAGKRVRNGRVNTIIGLDPAGPLFDANNPVNRLDQNDAQYVEVIHTDTQSFGIGAAIGDAGKK